MEDQQTSPQSLIEEGRRHYAAKHHRKALESFTRAMKRCPCSRGLKRDRCTCKNFQRVADEGGSIFHEAMYTCSCAVGKTFSKCPAADHVTALDSRAATFEAMGELARARADAEWLLEIAPRRLEGYLRLGKVARLQKHHEFAWRVYNAGIEAAEPSTKPSLLQKLYQAREPLNRRFSRHDPLLALPLEILQVIFHSFDLPTLVRCTRVSKGWRSYLTGGSNQRLWRQLCFPSAIRRAVSGKALNALVRFSGSDVREIVIGNMSNVSFTDKKLMGLLQASRQLETLELSTPALSAGGVTYSNSRAFKKLERFVIKLTTRVAPSSVLFLQHLVADMPNLRYLYAHSCVLDTLVQPNLVFPQLKYLRLDDERGHQSAHLPKLWAMAPNLEQLWWNEIQYHTGLEDMPFDAWPNLKVFICHPSTDGLAGLYGNVSRVVGVNGGRNLQHLDLGTNTFGMSGENVLFENPWGSEEPGEYLSLRSLMLARLPLDGEPARRFFESSLRSDHLRTFTIIFPHENLNQREGEGSAAHLASYKWLEGSSSITTLRLSNFAFRKYDDHESGPLASFIASLPNLRTLQIGSEFYSGGDLCPVIEGIIKTCPSIELILVSEVWGVHMDRLREIAKQHDVIIRDGDLVSTWPVELDQDQDQ